MIFIGHKREENERVKFLKKLIDNVKTLDLGASDGRLIDKVINPINITAVDIYGDEIKKNKASKKIICDIRKLPLRDNSYPQVTMLEVIEHQKEEADRLKVLKESFRVLKKGGYFFMSTPNINRLSTYFNLLILKKRIFPNLMGEDKTRIYGNYHYVEYNKKTLRELLTRAGFKKIKFYNYYLQLPFPRIALFLRIKSLLGPTLFVKCQK